MQKLISKTKGLIAAPFTPMDPSGQLDLSRIPDYALWLKQNGVVGAFICGTTGEGPSLTTRERIKVAEAWAEADEGLLLIVHVGHNSLAEAQILAGHAQSIKASAIGCMPPQFFRPGTVGQVAECCAAVPESAPDVPFYYYHIPSMSGVEIKVADLLPVLAERLPAFTGIKFTYEDLDDFKACLEYDNRRYDILFGRDEKLLSAVELGAVGAVGSTYNFAAPLYLKLMNFFHRGDNQAAALLQEQAIGLIETCIKGSWHPIAAFKQLMSFIGVDCGPCRLPIPSLSTNQVQQLEEQTRTFLQSDTIRNPISTYNQ